MVAQSTDLRIDPGSALGRLVGLIVLLTLGFGLVLPKLAGAGYLALGLVALIWLSLRGGWFRPGMAAHEKLLVMAVVVYVAVWLLAWLTAGLDRAGLDGAGRVLRLLLIVPIYLLIRRTDGLEAVWWRGLALGAATAGIYALASVLTDQTGDWQQRVGGPTNPIYFGGLALAFGLMLLPRVDDRQLPLIIRGGIALAIGLALTASALSSSRGAWLALPALLALYWWTLGAQQRLLRRLLIPASLTLFAGLVSLAGPVPLYERFAETTDAYAALREGRPPSGTLGVRLELWQLAAEQIAERPLRGSGPDGFRQALLKAIEAGRVNPDLAVFRHPHNQYLSALSAAGPLGLIALLFLFAMPVLRFVRLWQSGLERTRLLGWCGLAAIVVLATMALSESIFERNTGIVWFGLLTAMGSGLVQSRRRQELYGAAPVRAHTLGVTMICKNEADRIDAALESVAGWADELVVLDSGSSDHTVEICRRYTDRVEVTDWPGYGRQKQRALERIDSDWVLSLDADEVVSDELRREIDLVLAQPRPHFEAYLLPWSVRAFGGTLQFGHWARAPLRLFARAKGHFTDAPVHEKVVMRSTEARIGRLEAPLYHDTYRDLKHAQTKLAGYARLKAADRARRRRGSVFPWTPWLRATANFLDNFLLRGAFLDGRPGWTMAWLHAWYTFQKYHQQKRLRLESGTDTQS